MDGRIIRKLPFREVKSAVGIFRPHAGSLDHDLTPARPVGAVHDDDPALAVPVGQVHAQEDGHPFDGEGDEVLDGEPLAAAEGQAERAAKEAESLGPVALFCALIDARYTPFIAKVYSAPYGDELLSESNRRCT